MKIVVLSGSPKVKSFTKQDCMYLQKAFNEYDIEIIDIGYRINQIEKKEELFNEIIGKIENSDGVLWASPVYCGVIPSQFMRFVELIFERNMQKAFKGKYVATLTTSLNMADNVAAAYLNAIYDDLDMKYVGCCPLHMKSMAEDDMRETMKNFMEQFLNAIKEKRETVRNYNKVKYEPIIYKQAKSYEKIDLKDKKVIILVDSTENDNLNNMIKTFKSNFLQDIEVVNIGDNLMRGGCIGCMRCSYDYSQCHYNGKDNFIEFYKNKVMTADAVVIAGELKDRYLSSTWKRFIDRTFFNNHTPTLEGKQLIYLVAGPYRQLPNLSLMFETFTQYQSANLLEALSDEYDSSEKLDSLIYSLCKRMVYTINNNYCKPKNFLGVGGRKVLRDEIYGDLRYPLIGDYRSFRKNKYLDYPYKNFTKRITNNILIFLITVSPKMRDKINNDPKGSPFYRYVKDLVDNMQA